MAKHGKLTRNLSRVLRDARRDAGLTQEDLAFAADVHPTYVSQLERGILSPTIDKLEDLSESLGVSVAVLIKRAES